MTTHHISIAIIGGGAAGYFAAIEAKRNCPMADITIFEKNPKMLAKVEITGGRAIQVFQKTRTGHYISFLPMTQKPTSIVLQSLRAEAPNGRD